ncbi:MAG: DNA polymerase I [Bacteroidetes bacterium HGW-Bacteroidetes-21]|jgi:DNA polymerase-1|nr:MAG: DNA polymerase I [Bacteroidetes bacterium HGW-Bacteroidetes-21]
MENKIFFFDAYALIYRSYYAFIRNPRITSKGMNTSAIFGFVNTLADVLYKEKPTHLAVVFDPPGPTFRNEMYDAYKANREETPEDIRKSVPILKKILDALNIAVVEIPGFEADDVIGTLAFRTGSQGLKTYMMTPDKDYCQLVGENIFIYKPARSGGDVEIIGVEEVKKIFQINEPKQVVDVLALWGDASDNVPGAPGIGEKTAKQLISQYGNLENLYHNINKLTARQKTSLEENKERVLLARKLVTIETAVPMDFSIEASILRQPDTAKLTEIFDELEFRSITNRILNTMGKAISDNSGEPEIIQPDNTKHDLFNQEIPVNNPAHNYLTIKDIEKTYHLTQKPEEVNHLISLLISSGEFCFDTETTGLDPMQSELVGMSFAVKEGEAFYVPVPQNKEEASKLTQLFKPVFENPVIAKIGQNIKFDMLMLRNYDIEVQGNLFDTMLAHYVLDPEQPHNLDHLARVYLNYLPIPIEELIGKKGRSQLSMRLADPDRLKDYACEDADVCLKLKNILEKEIEKEGLHSVFYDIEMPLVPVLTDMEFHGVRPDIKALKDMSHRFKEEQRQIEKEIFELSGMQFNMNSPKQLGDVLFVKLKIVSDPSLTKTKQFSTSEETLQKLAGKHPIIDKILDYRSLQKLVSTYTDSLQEQVNPRTRRIHTSFNQAVTSTGRLSSTNPNLQNIPIREARGREVRKAFLASDDSHIFLSADYSQIELRLMAHFSQDPVMIEAFSNHEDIHKTTAAKVYKITPEEVTKEQRSRAKTANFGIIYGISAFGLSERMAIPRSEAKQIIDSYFETFPGVKKYMDECIRTAREKGEVYTLSGRKRKLPDINSRNGNVRGMAERNAINAPIQGTAADVIKIAMAKIYQAFHDQGLKSKMLLQVHDELNFDIPQNELEKATEIIRREMENTTPLDVPLTVEIGTGKNWFDAH